MPLKHGLSAEMSSIPERPSSLAAIEACSLLNALSPSDREHLAASSFMAYAERGEFIWMAGSPAEFCAVVAVGFVKMTRGTARGQEVAVELLGPGQCLGLLAAIEGRTLPLSATAVTNCWYLKVPTRVLRPVYEGSDQFKDQILRNIGPRLRKAHDMITRLSSGKVEERLAVVLFILAESYGTETESGMTIGVPLTRQDLSEMAGTTTETTIRVLSKWQKMGVIATEHQMITLLDQERLTSTLLGEEA